VAVRSSGICGSDKWMWQHQEPVRMVIGHEAAGEIVGLGGGVHHLRVGDRVAINNVVGCGICPACRAGEFVLCPHWDGSRDVNGGFGELLKTPARNCMPLADAIDDETACLLMDNFGTPYAALERLGVKTGDDVLVMGCGPIGLAAVSLAKMRGAFVIACDPIPPRRQFALSLGADAGLAPDADLPKQVRERTSGMGVRAAVECSGHPSSYPLALQSLRFEGVLMTLGEHGRMDLHPSDLLIRRRLAIIGNWYSTMQQGRAVQELVLQGKIDPRRLVSHRAPLAEFPALYRLVCESPELVRKAVLLNPS